MKTQSYNSFRNDSTSEGKFNGNEKKHSHLMKLFENELRDIYGAEKALKKAIPRMMEFAVSEELIDTLDIHLTQTKLHISRIERIFKLIGREHSVEKCEAIEGLIREGEEIIRNCEKGAMRDAGIISAAQKIEHYEIAAYGTLRQFALTLDLHEAVILLEQTLREEKTADDDLTIVAVFEVNVLADDQA